MIFLNLSWVSYADREMPNEGKRMMLETRFTEFPASSVNPRVGISRSASEIVVLIFYLPMKLKIIIYHSSFLPFFGHLT